MPGKARCLVRGSINIDEFFHVPSIVRPGQTLSSTRYERRAGGKGANQAVAVARAGKEVVLAGAIGKDGEWLAYELDRYGVDTSRVVRVAQEPTGRAIIQLTPEGENSIILHRGANYFISSSDPQPNYTGYTHILLQNEIPFQTTLAYLTPPRSPPSLLIHPPPPPPTITFFNPSPMPTPPQISQFPWTHLTWLILNEGEALDLLQTLGPFQPSTPHIQNPTLSQQEKDSAIVYRASRVLRDLHSHPKFHEDVKIVCTLGPSGVLALVPDLEDGSGSSDELVVVYVPAAKIDPDEVRDTTGAGDCFTGYLVAGLMDLHDEQGGSSGGTGVRGDKLKKEDLIRVLERCVEAAGLCVRKHGAMESIPSRTEVDAHMKALMS